MIIKVCGMREAENIRQVEDLGIDLMGFIFYGPSPRCVGSVPEALPEKCRRVGVFVNQPLSFVSEMARLWGLHFVQLHGDESPKVCGELKAMGLGVIKAFSVRDAKTLVATKPYEQICDYFLFDTPCATGGGSGRSFDWDLLQAYDGQTPFLLSGGISPASISALKRFSHPRWEGVDLNSGFETAPGMKDVDLLSKFKQDFL